MTSKAHATGVINDGRPRRCSELLNALTIFCECYAMKALSIQDMHMTYAAGQLSSGKLECGGRAHQLLSVLVLAGSGVENGQLTKSLGFLCNMCCLISE